MELITRRQKLVVIAVIVCMFFLGAWLSAGTPSPDQERLQIEITALKDGYAEQIRHAYNEAIDAFVVKGRQHAVGSFQRHLNSIRTVYKDCREFIKK
jgi:hypothetical protein